MKKILVKDETGFSHQNASPTYEVPSEETLVDRMVRESTKKGGGTIIMSRPRFGHEFLKDANALAGNKSQESTLSFDNGNETVPLPKESVAKAITGSELFVDGPNHPPELVMTVVRIEPSPEAVEALKSWTFVSKVSTEEMDEATMNATMTALEPDPTHVVPKDREELAAFMRPNGQFAQAPANFIPGTSLHKGEDIREQLTSISFDGESMPTVVPAFPNSTVQPLMPETPPVGDLRPFLDDKTYVTYMSDKLLGKEVVIREEVSEEQLAEIDQATTLFGKEAGTVVSAVISHVPDQEKMHAPVADTHVSLEAMQHFSAVQGAVKNFVATAGIENATEVADLIAASPELREKFDEARKKFEEQPTELPSGVRESGGVSSAAVGRLTELVMNLTDRVAFLEKKVSPVPSAAAFPNTDLKTVAVANISLTVEDLVPASQQPIEPRKSGPQEIEALWRDELIITPTAVPVPTPAPAPLKTLEQLSESEAPQFGMLQAFRVVIKAAVMRTMAFGVNETGKIDSLEIFNNVTSFCNHYRLQLEPIGTYYLVDAVLDCMAELSVSAHEHETYKVSHVLHALSLYLVYLRGYSGYKDLVAMNIKQSAYAALASSWETSAKLQTQVNDLRDALSKAAATLITAAVDPEDPFKAMRKPG